MKDLHDLKDLTIHHVKPIMIRSGRQDVETVGRLWVGVSGSGFRFSVFDFRVSGSEFQVSGFGSRVSSFGLRVSGFGLRASGFGVGV